MFDVTIGSFDRAEICKLIGLHVLDKFICSTTHVKFRIISQHQPGSC